MNFQATKGKSAGVPRIPLRRTFGNVGLDGDMESGSGDDEDGHGPRRISRDGLVMAQVIEAAPPSRVLLLREPQVAVETIVASVLNVIIEGNGGSTLAEATFNVLPTGATVLSLPIGSISLPSLEFQSGTVAAYSSLMPVATTAPTLPAASSQVGQSSALPSTPQASSISSHITAAPAIPTSIQSGNFTSHTLARASSAHASFPPTNGTHTSAGVAHSSSHLFSPFATAGGSHTTLQTSSISLSSSSILSSVGIIVTAASTTGNGAASTSNAAAATSTTAAAGAASGSTAPNTPAIAGGVVGGVAGIAILFVLLLLLLRWRRHKLQGAPRELASNPDVDTPRPNTSRSEAAMAQNSTQPFAAAAFMRSIRRHSGQTTASGNAPSERGFQKISGRKIEPAFLTGGDGYGAPGPGASETGVTGGVAGAGAVAGAAGTHLSAASSNYRDSNNTSLLVGPGSAQRSSGPTDSMRDTMQPAPLVPERKNPGFLRSSHGFSESPSPPPELSASPPDVVVMRPGPARQLVHSPGFSTPPQTRTPPPQKFRGPADQDPVGRSHPSFDGSRGSKFAENI